MPAIEGLVACWHGVLERVAEAHISFHFGSFSYLESDVKGTVRA